MNENIGGNAPCPCGSGRKFKRCCMGKQTPPKPAAAVEPRPGEAAPDAPATAVDGSGTPAPDQEAKEKAQPLQADWKKRSHMHQRDASRQNLHDPRINRRRGGR